MDLGRDVGVIGHPFKFFTPIDAGRALDCDIEVLRLAKNASTVSMFQYLHVFIVSSEFTAMAEA